MKAKRLAAAALAVITVLCASQGLTAGAKTQAMNPRNRSYAWLEDIYIRETAEQFVLTSPIPITDYPYSRTFAEFTEETEGFIKDYPMDAKTVKEEYYEFLSNANTVMTALGMTENYEEQRQWLENDAGILYPETDGEYTKMYTAVVYGALRYGLFKRLYGKDIAIAPGTGLEEAVVLYLDAYFDKNNEVSAQGIDTVDDYALEFLRNTLKKNGFDVNESTSEEELYRYASILFIREAGYEIDNDATQAEISAYYFVSRVYRAYGIKIQPSEMSAALEKPESIRSEAVRLLILKTMVEEKGGRLSEGATPEEAFEKALKCGYFKLKNGFYSDIFRYNVKLGYKRSSVWLTPVSFADQMPGGSGKSAVIKINGSACGNKTPFELPLDSSKPSQTIHVHVAYKAGSINQTKDYELTFLQGSGAAPKPRDDATDGFQLTTYGNATTKRYDNLSGLETLPGVMVTETGGSLPVTGFYPYETATAGSSAAGQTGGYSEDAESADVGAFSSLFKEPDWKTALAGGVLAAVAAAAIAIAVRKRKTTSGRKKNRV